MQIAHFQPGLGRSFDVGLNQTGPMRYSNCCAPVLISSLHLFVVLPEQCLRRLGMMEIADENWAWTPLDGRVGIVL